MNLYKDKSEIHGNGLFAGKSYYKGEYIEKFDLSPTRKENKFTIWVTESVNEEVIEVDFLNDISFRKKTTDEWLYKVTNILKYSNFSEKPNTEVYWYKDNLEMYAAKNIKKGTEITWNYEAEEL